MLELQSLDYLVDVLPRDSAFLAFFAVVVVHAQVVDVLHGLLPTPQKWLLVSLVEPRSVDLVCRKQKAQDLGVSLGQARELGSQVGRRQPVSQLLRLLLEVVELCEELLVFGGVGQQDEGQLVHVQLHIDALLEQ